jgi:DNA-binding LytR/AlgR family response regulator
MGALYENGIEALRIFKKNRHNIVFLDINIPGVSGLEVAREIIEFASEELQKVLSFVVFLTSCNKYMAEVYDIYDYDYLTNPLNYYKVKNIIESIYYINKKYSYVHTPKLKIKFNSDIYLIDINDIQFITREGRETIINTVWQEEIRTSETMEKLEKQLLGYSYFMRTHKSFIVNMSKVVSIRKSSKKVFTIYFRNTNKSALMTQYLITRRKLPGLSPSK